MAVGTLAAAYATYAVDGPGRLLFAVAAAGAAFETLRALLLRPTLRADAEGLEVVVGLRRERHPWATVTSVGTLEARGSRPRRRAHALEIDLGVRLLVVPAYRLGASVEDVAEGVSGMMSGASSRGGGG
jgi:hypothetical protein